MERTPRAILYTRVSTDKQVDEGTSLEVQESACLRKAKELGAEVVDIISDEGVSGAFYLSRPGIQKALALLEAKQADTLITMKLDRSGRDADTLGLIRKRITNAGARLVFVDGANFENNATGNLLFRMSAGFAEFEREVIRERTMSGSRKRAEQGLQPTRHISPFGLHIVTKADVLSGRYPVGTEGTYQIVEEEAQWVRALFQRYASGSSLRDLVRFLIQNDVPTKHGKRIWYRCSVQSIIGNPAYKGKPQWGKSQRRTDEERLKQGYKNAAYTIPAPESNIITLSAPPLVDEETWEICQQRRKENKERASGNPKRRYMLTGFLRCPVCKRCMTGRGNNSPHRRYYLCKLANGYVEPGVCGCVKTHYHMDRTEKAIVDALLSCARQPERMAAAVAAYDGRQRASRRDESQIESLQAKLTALEQREQATARAQVEALLQGRSTSVYDGLLSEIDAERKRLQPLLAAQSQQDEEPKTFDAHTEAEKFRKAVEVAEAVLTADDVTPAEKHTILAAVVKTIIPEGEGFLIQTVYNISP
jgi:site-specific DNA recombinase